MPRAIWLECVLALAPALACAEVLGIPTDPELVSQPTPVIEMPGVSPSGEPSPDPAAAGGAPSGPAGLDRPSSDGVVPPEQVSGIDGSGRPPEEPPSTADTTEEAARPGDAGTDAAGTPPDLGLEPAADAGVIATDDCPAELERVAVDVVFIADNTSTMAASNAELEQALPQLAARLDELLVDYRLILLSRHREALRGTSDTVDSSLCIDAPLGLRASSALSP